VQQLVPAVMPAVVGVRIGAGQGSGVIIDQQGHVLTAGHVSGKPGRDVIIILQDGRKVRGITLGANREIDSGLIKITEAGDWFHVHMAPSGEVAKGQWCLSLGHPGGVRQGRPPVVRLGRVLAHADSAIRTDCTLVGGDSGGPLFDMYGRVIGIHSRIGTPITANIHVPVATYRDTWERLARSDYWGDESDAPYIGIKVEDSSKVCRVVEVDAGSPAERAGLRSNDVIVAFAGKAIASIAELGTMLDGRRPDQEVDVLVRRGEATMTVTLRLGRRP
jgi:serine protease Do